MKIAWPRKAEEAQRTDLLVIAHEHLKSAQAYYVKECERYDEEIIEWRSSVRERLLEMIPKYEAQEVSWNPADFEPPPKPYRHPIERVESIIEVLQHLDVETISPALRGHISKALGVIISYD
jgi:hypothetical protein